MTEPAAICMEWNTLNRFVANANITESFKRRSYTSMDGKGMC